MIRRIVAAAALCANLLLPPAAWAQTTSRSPLDYSLKQYSVFLGAAVLGGFVSWYSKVRAGVLPATSINHLVGELCTSAFAGLMCFWMCESVGTPSLLTAALTGIAGHMGTRSISLIEEWAARKFGATGK